MKKVAVVFGATAGIGQEVAKRLVGLDFHVVGIGRNEDVVKTWNMQHVDFIKADLSLVKENQRVIDELYTRFQRIDILVLSAGMLTDQSWLTSEGLEVNFASHHLSRAMQAEGLVRLLQKSDHPKVIYISPVGQHKQQDFDLEEIATKSKKGIFTCLRSYVLNDFFFQNFHRKYANISVIGFNPGPTKNTQLDKRHASAKFMRWIKPIFLLIAKDVATVVDTLINKSGSVAPGIYYFSPKKDIQAPPFLTNSSFGNELWKADQALIEKTLNINLSVNLNQHV